MEIHWLTFGRGISVRQARSTLCWWSTQDSPGQILNTYEGNNNNNNNINNDNNMWWTILFLGTLLISTAMTRDRSGGVSQNFHFCDVYVYVLYVMYVCMCMKLNHTELCLEQQLNALCCTTVSVHKWATLMYQYVYVRMHVCVTNMVSDYASCIWFAIVLSSGWNLVFSSETSG